MNIGTNPTFNEDKQSIEVHFFETDKNLYDTTLKIDILHRLRNEQKFEDVKHLVSQLNLDKENSQNFIKKYDK